MRRRRAAVLASLLLVAGVGAAAARADVADYLGKPVVVGARCESRAAR